MPNGTAMSFTAPNYSGLLYGKSNTETPFFDELGAVQYTDHVEFPTNSDYVNEAPQQPGISEQASLTAPTPTFITRDQSTNVTQIYHEAVSVSYAKMSNMGTMSGINVAGDSPNVQGELDWQIARRMEKIKQDIEYTFLRGVFAKATNDTMPNQTRGILSAITTNKLDASGGTLSVDMVNAALKAMYDSNAAFRNVKIYVSAAQKMKISSLYPLLPGYKQPDSRNVGGFAFDRIVTDFGTFDIIMSKTMQDSEILFADMAICRPVEQATPSKGNFFYEETARTGAGIMGQIFGQIGLDHGAEWHHGKIAGLTV